MVVVFLLDNVLLCFMFVECFDLVMKGIKFLGEMKIGILEDLF